MYFGGKMMTNSPTMSMYPMVHSMSSQDPPVVLDLCIKKRPISPAYHPYDFSTRSSPPYPDTCISPKSTSGFSESSDVSSTENKDFNANFRPSKLAKINRPFKAFPKDPLAISFIGTVGENLLNKDSFEAYAQFRDKMLAQVKAVHNGTNKNMRRIQQQNQQIADPSYWEKRKKNNEAAKRSRDARKAKEDEIAIRCAFLEQENLQLKFRLAALESERERLQKMVFHQQ